MNRHERFQQVKHMTYLWAKDAVDGYINDRLREDEDFRISNLTNPKEIIKELMDRFDVDRNGEDSPILIAARKYVEED